MAEPVTSPERIALPLLATEPGSGGATRAWHGWTMLDLPTEPTLGLAEPIEPQGAYGDQEVETLLDLPAVPEGETRPVELLAPAGGPEAAFAAFHFGADAVYLGLKKFSARAEAENFTIPEVDEITAYAHSLQPRRRVFVTINTLIRQDETDELVEAIAALADIGVDALIVQDLGVYGLVRRHFPQLELHASTQLSVHNRAGADVLHRLGFSRVVLARELTFEEVRDITGQAGIETEVFIHGALCYSYSGLCLFSSQTLGRSGNRGRCAYSCRDSFEVAGAPLTLRDGGRVKRAPRQGFPFSMKDPALPDHIPALRSSGVSCFKIEGRKKSPLYVATTTDYYRRLIDGQLAADERPALEADLQTVFSRPWTRLFVQSHKDKEVADRDTVGHRGTPIGRVEEVSGAGSPAAKLRFRSARPLERHDGLQVDLPELGKPFGFAVDRLWLLTPGKKGKRHEVFEAPAGALVEVGLPRDHVDLPVGAPVYCSSSQAVKRHYQYGRPKPGLYRSRKTADVELVCTADRLSATGRWRRGNDSEPVEATCTLAGPFSPARDPAALETAARSAFEKLGSTALELGQVVIHDPERLFVPISRLNQLRRDLSLKLEEAITRAQAAAVQAIRLEAAPRTQRGSTHATRSEFNWHLKVDRIAALDALEGTDLAGVEEIIVDIARDHPALLQQRLDQWAARIGKERLRLALPPLTRSWEEKGLRHKIDSYRAAGWTKWEVGNLSAWSFLGLDPHEPAAGIDLATDWSVYVINRLAAQQVLQMGARRFTLSPEDGLANVRSLLAEFGPQAVLIVYQDTPLFLAESCAYANLIGGCPGKANCRFESMTMVSSHGEKVTALDYHCRTIVLNREPFCLAPRLGDLARAGAVHLRADFIYRPYDPREVRDLWRLVRAGRQVPGGQAANFDRGIQ
jgi:putative protease